MIRRLFFPGLLDTGPVSDRLLAIRDGFVNCYIWKTVSGLVCVDAGRSPKRTARGFAALGLNLRDVTAVFLTHLHWDHAGGARLFPNAKVYVGDREASSVFAARSLPRLIRVRDEETVLAGGLAVRVVDTPGHTSGSVSYLLDDRFLFVGDTLRLRRGEALPMLRWFNRDGQVLDRGEHLRLLLGRIAGDRFSDDRLHIERDPALGVSVDTIGERLIGEGLELSVSVLAT